MVDIQLEGMTISVQIVCGIEQVKKSPLPPYSELVCEFLDEYASMLRKDAEARRYPDVQTFAFWARKSNIQKKKIEFKKRTQSVNYLGRGIVFHVAPSNVPVNCMFTYAFRLLSGNANIVRIPSKAFPQVECMCRILKQCLQREEFQQIYEMTSIVKYEKNKEITDRYSGDCNIRVVWGGDETIHAIRNSELPARSIEITFADRYSFGIIDAKKWKNADVVEKKTIAEGFYNDTYLMDQNACSTPHLICWDVDGLTKEEYTSVQVEFWKTIQRVAVKYDLADIKVSEKYASLCEEVIENKMISKVEKYDNLLYVCDVEVLNQNMVTSLRGKYGLFFQYVLHSIDDIHYFSNEKVQTCAYFGDKQEELLDHIIRNGFCGIDRIVPFGKTLNIDTIWDGYDLVAQMSRIIEISK